MSTIDKKIILAYDDGRNVYLIHRDKGEKKTKKVSNYPWYFIVDSKHHDTVKKLEETVVGVKVIKENEKYTKIFCRRDWDFNDTRIKIRRALEKKEIEPLEFDLSLTKRYMVDEMPEIDTDLKICFFDIETDDSIGTIEIGRDRIISWAICDQEGNTTFFTDKNEELVLDKFLDEIDKYDVIAGWNSQEFDVPYIKSRMGIYGMKYNWKQVIEFDLMKRLIKLFRPMMTTTGLAGFSLEEVSQTFLGKGKIKHEEKIFELERDKPELLKEYNINDVVLLYELDKKLSLFDLMIKECEWTGTFLNRFYIGELLDNYILREAHKQCKYLKSQREWSTDRVQVKGAYVMPPVRGLHNNIRVFDFKSMYPSIIVTWNISQDTILPYTIHAKTIEEAEEKIKENEKKISVPFIRTSILKDYNVSDEERLEYIEACKISGQEIPMDYSHPYSVVYYTKDKGIYSDLIKYLLKTRQEYKKKQIESAYGSVEYNNSKAMQEVVKQMANSMFGTTGDPNSRFFNKDIAESITLSGQYAAKVCREAFRDLGYETYYGDTDSLFVRIDDESVIDSVIKKVNEMLKTTIVSNYNPKDYIMSLDYEKTFDPLILIEKKKYTGFMIDLDGKPVNKIFTRGIELVKKDTIEYTRSKLKKMIDDILIEKKELSHFIKMIEELKFDVFTNNIKPELLKISKRVSKPISEYKKSKPAHVRLAEEKIKNQEILETQSSKNVWGQKIEYIVINAKKIGLDGKTFIDVIDYKDFNGIFDRTYYWNIQVFNVLKRILDVVYPDYDWEQYKIKPERKLRIKK